jgi:hypothetical protein
MIQFLPRFSFFALLSRARRSFGVNRMVVDQAPFLKKALSACKRLRKELHKKQALLSDFEEDDRNAFQQWLNSTHGKALTKIRALREETAEYQFILHHLSQCAHYDYEAVPALYETLLDLKKKGALYSYEPPKQPDPFGFGDDPDGEDYDDEWDNEDDDEDWDDEDDEDMRAFFDRMFGGGAAEDSDAGMPKGKSAQKAANDNARLKTCYRTLAKRLHPDHSQLEESIREKRWHEIQEAYQNSDLEALLRVEAICDMDDSGLSAELGLARLRDLAAYHKSHLIPLRRALREAKQDIAFGFSRNGPSAKVKRDVAEDLKDERFDVKDMLGHMKRSAAFIRDQVLAQIRENEAAHAQAVRRAERAKVNKAKRKGNQDSPRAESTKAKAKRPAPRPAPKVKPPRKKEPVAEDSRQMSFF